jgi:hypothetical protein
MVLHALLAERNCAEKKIHNCLEDVADYGTKFDPLRDIDPEYNRLDKYLNETNRTMYQVYSDSKHMIHENNFSALCRPHLRNLLPLTAFELQAMRQDLIDSPPYRLIQQDPLPDPSLALREGFTNLQERHRRHVLTNTAIASTSNPVF